MNKFDRRILQDVSKHILKFHPQEIVGGVFNNEYVEFENIAHNPEERFEISAEDMLRLYKENGKLVHSHNASRAVPSEQDIEIVRLSRLESYIVAFQNGEVQDIVEVVDAQFI